MVQLAGRISRGALRCGERRPLSMESTRVSKSKGIECSSRNGPDIADDSYHAAWFGGVAEEFERAVTEGTDSPIARRNLAQARVALVLIEASRKSSINNGADIETPLSAVKSAS